MSSAPEKIKDCIFPLVIRNNLAGGLVFPNIGELKSYFSFLCIITNLKGFANSLEVRSSRET